LDEDRNSIEIEMAGTFQHPTWSLDGQRLFFFAKNESTQMYSLYMGDAPDFTPVLIAENVFERKIGIPTWVMP
jgi:hypothetical protein